MKTLLPAALAAAVLCGGALPASAAGDEVVFRQNGYALTWVQSKRAMTLTAPVMPAKTVSGLTYADGEITLDTSHQVILIRTLGGTACPGGGGYVIDIISAKAKEFKGDLCDEAAEVAVEGT